MGYCFSFAVTAWATVLSFASVVLSDNVVSLYHNLKFIDVIFFLENKKKIKKKIKKIKFVYSYKQLTVVS